MMRSRLIRKEVDAQIDAFAVPSQPSIKAPARSRQKLSGPARSPIVEPQELWLAAHLPQLTADMHGKSSAYEWPTRKVLERLATGAQRFTPRVSLVPPDGLLLEVKGSLNLFGGVEGLRRAVQSLHQSAGLEPVLAFAPTPLAALALARACQQDAVMNRGHLVGHIASVALVALRWPEKVLERLAKIGVSTIGQALRLPRTGFARRFGAAQLASLDCLTGRKADPRAAFHSRERFYRRRDFNYELKEGSLLLRMLEPLLHELERFLQLRQCGITWLEFRLRHRHAPPTLCLLRLAAPAADARRLSALLNERLMTLALPEPVRSCELRTSSIVPKAQTSGGMWQRGEHGGEAGAEPGELIEYLRARLGDEAVHGLQLMSDHRPEKQSVFTQALSRQTEQVTRPHSSREAGKSLDGSAMGQPLWLLPVPRLLSGCADLRVCGSLRRIESGWWDDDANRDYYVACDPHGVRLWIFRERNTPRRWFLHGMFG